MILGHLTVTAAGHRLLSGRLGPSLDVPLGPLLLGAYVPDLLDKPIAWLTGLSGRGYGHSLVLQLAVFALAFAVLGRYRLLLRAVALGAALHLLEDWVTLDVLLAPLLGPIPEMPQVPLLDKLLVFYTSGSPQMWLEVAALVYWSFVGTRAWLGRSASVPGSAPGPA
jgi:membrane-bound metal-dependent hydrolase YbcI (DUF457 family)